MVNISRYLIYSLVVSIFSLPLVASAEVGYAMRGDTQPFSNWDGPFNVSAADSLSHGLLLKLGSFSVRPHVGGSYGYDDNVYLSHDNGVSDTYYSIAPGIMLIYGKEDSDYISLNYEYMITKYSDATELDYDSHLFSVGLHLTPGQLQIHLSDQFSDTLNVDRETAQRTPEVQNTENLSISREISSKSSFVVSQGYTINDYKNDVYLNYDELWAGGSFHHRTLPKVTTFVGGRYGIVDMKDSDAIGDAEYIEGDIGLQGRVTAKSTLHAQVGIQNRTFDDEGMQDITEWTALIGLSSRFSSRTYWGLDFFRGLTPSSQREGYTRLSSSIMPSIRHILWRNHVALSLSGAYELDDYYSPTGKESYNDRYWYITGMVDWSPLQPFNVGLGYTYTRQTSDIEENEYEDNLIFLRCMVNY